MEVQSMKWIFTTSHKPAKQQVLKAQHLANEYSGKYISRRHVGKYVDEKGFYFVVEKDMSLSAKWKGGSFFYHPSISKIKMKTYTKTGHDFLIESIHPSKEDVVLDLTMGLGSEALLIANFSKEVVGVEGAFPTYLVVKEGLKNYKYKENWMIDASKKIKIINNNYKTYIRTLKDNSIDIVYCDPMFENPNYKSSSLNPLRRFAVYDLLTQEDIDEMFRISKKRVVIKARDIDSIWNRIKVEKKMGSKRSGIIFGVIEKK